QEDNAALSKKVRAKLVEIANTTRGATRRGTFEQRKKDLKKNGGVRVLALDGGGTRGVISVEVLRALEIELRAQPGHEQACILGFFDFIIGTSTGGLISVLATGGFPLDSVDKAYDALSNEIFNIGKIKKAANLAWSQASYSSQEANMRGAVRTLFGDDHSD